MESGFKPEQLTSSLTCLLMQGAQCSDLLLSLTKKFISGLHSCHLSVSKKDSYVGRGLGTGVGEGDLLWLLKACVWRLVKQSHICAEWERTHPNGQQSPFPSPWVWGMGGGRELKMIHFVILSQSSIIYTVIDSKGETPAGQTYSPRKQ